MSFLNVKVSRFSFCLWLSCFAFMQNTNAQQRAIDSVSALLQKHPADDSAKVDLMVQLSAFYQAANLGKAQFYLAFASKLFNDNYYADQNAKHEINLAKVVVSKKQYDSAIIHFNHAYSIFSELDAPYQVADVCQHIADIYMHAGKYDVAE